MCRPAVTRLPRRVHQPRYSQEIAGFAHLEADLAMGALGNQDIFVPNILHGVEILAEEGKCQLPDYQGGGSGIPKPLARWAGRSGHIHSPANHSTAI